jgi:hypothetical protein
VTEFKSFNLFLNRMAKKKTTQGIGYINNRTEFDNLVLSVTNIIVQEFNRTSDNATAINNVKRRIDELVGRTRQSFTKTDVYQVSYLMFYPILKELARTENRTFKETQINTLVAKLMTEGEYGNPSVVRRQTTDAKILTLRAELFPSLVGGIVAFANYVYYSLTGAQQRDLNLVAQRMLVRGSRSTSTTRVSNRTRRSTPPRSTTPRATTPAAPSIVTEISRQVTAYQVADLTSSSQLLVGMRESIKRFGETSDKKVRLELIAGAWRYRALASLILNESERLTISDLKNFTNGVITAIGDVYNPAIPGGGKFKEAVEYLKYVVFLLTSGKMRSAKILMGSNRFIGETRATLSRKIFALGIGSTSVTVFSNFVRYIGGDNRTYTAITRVLTGGPEMIISIFAGYLRGTFSVPTQTFRQTEAISTSQLERNSTPTQVEVRATPDTAVTDLVKEAKFKNTLGIEIEYQEVTFGEMQEGLKKAKIDLYPRYLGYHERVDYDKYKQWRIMYDSSLRDRFGRDYPLNVYNTSPSTKKDIKFGELVSPILVGEKGLLQLIRALNTMTKLGATNNQSTGLHIHLGIKDTNQPFGISYKGLRNFIVNYIGFEKIIDSYTRKSRRQNNHRQYTPSPILDIWRTKNLGDGRIADVSYRELEDLSRKLNAYDDTEFRRWAVSTLQRGKLNPHSNGLKFSFEIRQHGGTIERDTIMGWILFMHYLCVFSEKKISTRFTWKNLSENILPKPLASFWQNRIADMSGEAMDWDWRNGSWKTLPDIFDGPVKR